jgi:hypothetical protein
MNQKCYENLNKMSNLSISQNLIGKKKPYTWQVVIGEYKVKNKK